MVVSTKPVEIIYDQNILPITDIDRPILVAQCTGTFLSHSPDGRTKLHTASLFLQQNVLL